MEERLNEKMNTFLNNAKNRNELTAEEKHDQKLEALPPETPGKETASGENNQVGGSRSGRGENVNSEPHQDSNLASAGASSSRDATSAEGGSGSNVSDVGPTPTRNALGWRRAKHGQAEPPDETMGGQHALPGAYPTSGRAPGTVPVWARRRRQAPRGAASTQRRSIVGRLVGLRSSRLSFGGGGSVAEDGVDEATTSTAEESLKTRKKWIPVTALLAVVVAVVVVLAIVFTRTSSTDSAGSIPISATSPVPTITPSYPPSRLPTSTPSHAPSGSSFPSRAPTSTPSRAPSASFYPSQAPSQSRAPSISSAPSEYVPPRYRMFALVLQDFLGSTFLQQGSHELEAFEWLVYDDPAVIPEDSPPEAILERYTMAVLFFSTNGTAWRNQYQFLSDASVCEWNDGFFNGVTNGVTCTDGSITKISIRGNELAGTLPESIGALPSLRTVDLSFNRISGVIPPFSGNLGLHTVNLQSNSLTGDIDYFLSSLSFPSSLTTLDIDQNSLSGTIPTVIGTCNGLTLLDVGPNDFTGPIPSEVGLLTQLVTLDLESSRISGTIPTELGFLTNLWGLGLSFLPGLEGGLPTQLGSLTSLEVLLLKGTRLGGTILTEIGSLQSMQWLDLSNMALSGALPSEMGLLTILTSLSLNSNPISGTVPVTLGLLTALETLYLHNTSLRGDVGAAFCSQSSPPEIFSADCNEVDVTCSCCSTCWPL